MRWNQDILADDMSLAGPELVKIGQARIVLRQVAGKGNIVQERVEPDERDIARVEREFDTPGQSPFWSGNAEVAGKPIDRVNQLVPTQTGDDEIRVCFDKIFEPLPVFYQGEIPVLFLEKDNLTPFGSEVTRLISFLVSKKLLLANTVVPGVLRLC